jgi:hypothetical protein
VHRNLSGSTSEFRTHVAGTGAGTAEAIPYSTSGRKLLGGKIGSTFFRTPVVKAIERAATNAVAPVAEPGVLYGPDVIRVKSSFARAENARLGYERYAGGRTLGGLGPKAFFSAVELNPSDVNGGSGFSENILPQNAIRNYYLGKQGFRSQLGEIAGNVAGKVGRVAGRAGLGLGSLVGKATGLNGLAPSSILKGSFDALKTGPITFGAGVKAIGKGVGIGYAADLAKDVLRNSSASQEVKTAGSLGLSRFTGELTPAGALLSTATRAFSAGNNLIDKPEYLQSVRKVAEEQSDNPLFKLGGLLGGLVGDAFYDDKAGGNLAGRQTVAHLIASAGEGVGSFFESIGGVKRVESLVSDYAPRNTPPAGSLSIADVKPTITPRKTDTEFFFDSLDDKLHRLTDPNLPAEERQRLYSSVSSDLSRTQSAVKGNAGSSNPNLITAQNYLESYPEKKKKLETDLLLNQTLGRAFARGYIPNFAYGRHSIFGARTRAAIRENGGVVNRGLKYFGPLGTIKNIIDSGDIREAKNEINNGGLPSSYTDLGFGSSDLGGLSRAIAREQDALVGRGIPRNLAKGFVFSGYHPEINGMGVGNILDEPAGMYNAAAGLTQGINRVKAHGGNPRTAGVPNYANESDDLVKVMKDLIAAVQEKNGAITDKHPDAAGGGVTVQHNIDVNASINGQIETKNEEVQQIFTQMVADLKARIEALESAAKGKPFTPRPPTATPVSTQPQQVLV